MFAFWDLHFSVLHFSVMHFPTLQDVNQPAPDIFTHGWGIISLILPSISLRPVAEIWYRIDY